jgi:hypothetical protein
MYSLFSKIRKKKLKVLIGFSHKELNESNIKKFTFFSPPKIVNINGRRTENYFKL